MQKTPMMALSLIACFTVALVGSAAQAASSNTYQQLDLLMDAFERIRAEYVEEVEDEELVEAAIKGMLTSLDPHSSYLSKEGFSALEEATRGEYGGLGIEVSMENGVIKVISPIEDTPADRAGVEGGDYITHIDGDAILGKSLTEAIKEMRGPAGEPITVTIVREGVDEPFDVTIIREAIRVRSVRHRIEDDPVGYVRITTFNEQTASGLRKALSDIRTDIGDELEGVVVDLRNNPGGLLDQAIEVSDIFLDRGEIVSTRGRDKRDTQRVDAKPGDLTGGVPVVVLVNAFSASASEIVAGALQDHRRGTIIGIPTFGKGTVQSIIQLGRGDRGMRLTTGRYYTPSGRSIQELGIDPDIEVHNRPISEDEARKPRRERDLENHLVNDQVAEGEAAKDKSEKVVIRAPEALEEGEDPIDFQLQYAIKHLKEIGAVPAKQASAN